MFIDNKETNLAIENKNHRSYLSSSTMADPLFPPQPNQSFFVTSLAGHNSNPIIPDAFFSSHLEDKNELMKLKLTSDVFEKTWEVKLNGRRFAGGWEDFSAAHCLRDDDVLIFRHDGDMVFHVTPSGRCFSQKQCISSSSGDSEDDEAIEDDDDDSEDSKNISSNKKSRLKSESTSPEKSCLLAVTPSNLRLNRVSLSRHFTRTNGLNKRWCEIDLMNQSGKSWVLGLRHNKITGQDFIRGGWRSFCHANKLKFGSFYRFKLIQNGTRPLLQLCSDITPQVNCSKANVSAKSNRESESASLKQRNFLTVTLKPYMLKSRQLRLPRPFAKENGIKKAGEIVLVDKNGVKWQSYVASTNEQGEFYMTKGWISFCQANGLKTGDTFTLEFVRRQDTTPLLKFSSKAKAKMEQAPFNGSRETVQASRDEEETEIQFQKRGRVSAEGGPSRRTRASSNKSSADPINLQRKQSLKPCSISNHVIKVKQSIMDTLTGVRRFRSELEIKEQNLEASLHEINALGEKVLEINKIIK